MEKIDFSVLNDERIFTILLLAEKMDSAKRKQLLCFAESLVNSMAQPPLPGLAEEVLNPFWTFYDSRPDQLNHSVKKGIIAIHPPSFSDLWNANGHAIPLPLIRRQLPFSFPRRFQGSVCVHSRIQKKTLKCWLFYDMVAQMPLFTQTNQKKEVLHD